MKKGKLKPKSKKWTPAQKKKFKRATLEISALIKKYRGKIRAFNKALDDKRKENQNVFEVWNGVNSED